MLRSLVNISFPFLFFSGVIFLIYTWSECRSGHLNIVVAERIGIVGLFSTHIGFAGMVLIAVAAMRARRSSDVLR
jgi:hypothetical protein